MDQDFSYQQPPRTNPFAITGLILGIATFTVGLVCCPPLFGIPGIIFSIIALNQIKQDPSQQGRGMAIAGLVLSAVGMVAGIILGLLFNLGAALMGSG